MRYVHLYSRIYIHSILHHKACKKIKEKVKEKAQKEKHTRMSQLPRLASRLPSLVLQYSNFTLITSRHRCIALHTYVVEGRSMIDVESRFGLWVECSAVQSRGEVVCVLIEL